MTTFAELRNRYVLHCTLQSEGDLHVGTGVAGATTDAPFIRQGGRPFLPGSTLRGVMRSTVERILRTLLGAGRCCLLFEEVPREVCVAGNQEAREEFERATAEDFDKMRPQLKFCPVCQLFGSTLMASRLKVSDARLREERIPLRRDGVGIDRDTETAKERIKFDFEVLEQGCHFEFSIQLENAEGSDFGLLYILLKEMEHGVDMGGRKARGLGRVRLTGYTVKYFDGEKKYGLEDYLAKGLATMPTGEFEAMLAQGFRVLRGQER